MTWAAISHPTMVLINYHLILNAIFLQLDIFLHFIHQQLKKIHQMIFSTCTMAAEFPKTSAAPFGKIGITALRLCA